jgi:hypothetical protein
MVTKYFLFWFPMIVLAFANATIREVVLVRYFNNTHSHQVSTITLLILCAIYTSFILKFLLIKNSKQAFIIGFLWVVFTVIFEFLLGRLTNKSWPTLLEQYDVTGGHLWPVFLIGLFFLPYFFYRIKRARQP